MQSSRYLPVWATLSLGCALLLGGCAAAVETNAEIDKGVHAPKRAIDMSKNIETDSNINQINQTLSLVKADNEGKAPATLEEAKAAAKGVPASMWIDSETGKPLEYSPVTGTVHRAGEAPKPAAGADTLPAPGGVTVPAAPAVPGDAAE